MQPEHLSAGGMQTPCVCIRYSVGSTFVSLDDAGHLGQSILLWSFVNRVSV